VTGRRKVCLVLEGTYPFVTGGVSAWVQELIGGTPEVDFFLYTISPRRDQASKYVLPPNVVGQRDIVINERQRIRSRPRGRRTLLAELRAMHEVLRCRSVPDLSGVLRRMPAGYFLYDDSCASEIGWRMIVSGNLRHNPIYPFAEYFWSWKSAHDMIFTVLGAEPPEADLYHAVSTGYAGLAALCAHLRTGKPFLLTEHGLYHKEREMEIKRASFVKGYQRDLWIQIYNGISRLCYRNADRVISLFEYNRRRQIEMGADEKRAVVIPNGIDLPRFGSVRRERREGFHVGLVGRVVPIKDIKMFVRVCRVVLEAMPDVLFEVIGPTDEDTAYYEECLDLAKALGVEKRCVFTGPRNLVKEKIYAELDIMALTSVSEGQPLTVLEAMCVGVPCVTTDVGSCGELLNGRTAEDQALGICGFVVPIGDADEFAQACLRILRDPALHMRMIETGWRRVDRFYRQSDTVRRYREIYAACAERSR
jgi:glycosyltransferase involved in cell wall biosynthesis